MKTQAASTKNGKRTWRRKAALGLLGGIGLWGVFAAWLLATAWYRVPGYSPASMPDAVSLILTSDEYGDVIESHARPYVYALDAPDGGRVVVFGAEHTKQPDDPQVEIIRAEWLTLRPTVALIESDLGMMFPMFMDPVRTFGEVGAVHSLARSDGIPTYTWEPPDERVIRSALGQGFTREQVALRWVLGPSFSNLRYGRPADPEAFVLDTFDERSSVEPIRGILTSMDGVEAAWAREFPNGPDWRDVSDQYGLPGFLGEIDLNRARDEHLVSCIAELIDAGERVFVIAGLSHAVKIESALSAIVD